MSRIALGIEYDGSRYVGWQRQAGLDNTIQAKVERALSQVADSPIQVTCAGRTDAGVHALNQIIHFDTDKSRSELAWVRGVNAYLPNDIRVLWTKEVPDTFDARKTAIAREYLYIISNRAVSPGILNAGKTWVKANLDVEQMQRGANFLLGKHDFTSFRSTQCQAKTAIRDLQAISFERRGEYILMQIKANAFLHHMVRNIVGTLVLVGRSLQAPEWVQEVLEAKNRCSAGVKAPPNGLYLKKVSYPNCYEIPQSDTKLCFI